MMKNIRINVYLKMINSFINKNNKLISCNVTTNNGANNLGVMLQIVQL